MSARMRRFGTSLAALLLAFALAGCGLFGDGSDEPSDAGRGAGGDTTTQVPPGFTRVSADSISLAYPDSWNRVEKLPEGLVLSARAMRDGLWNAQVSVLTNLGEFDDVRDLANLGLAYVRLADRFERTGHSRVDVAGAKEAFRVEYRYRLEPQGRQATNGSNGGDKGPQASGRAIRATDVALIGAQGKALIVRIAQVKGKLPEDTVNRIVDTIRMTKQ